MQVVLVMFHGDGERRSFSVARDMTVIGRREDCDLRIPVTDVSRKHCRLVKDRDMLRVEDLGSSNGTYINGQRVQEAYIKAGDVVQVGPVQFIVQIDGIPFDDDLVAPNSLVGETAAGEQVLGSDAVEEVLEEVPASSDSAVFDEVPLEEEGDEVSLDEEPLTSADLEEVEPQEVQLEEVEAASGLPAAEHVELEEVLELEEADEAPPAMPAAPIPSGGAAGEGDDPNFNFVIEDNESAASEDVQVDLNVPHEHQNRNG